MSQEPEAAQRTESGVTGIKETGSKGSKIAIDWNPIEHAVTRQGLSYAEASKQFGVKEHTIRMRSNRKNWKVTQRAVKTVIRKEVENQLSVLGKEITQSAIEEHKQRIFEIGSQSVRKFKAKAPKSFKDLKIADDITRRAAGIDDSDDKSVSLILVNEAIEGHEPIERATLLPDDQDDHSLGNGVAQSQSNGAAGEQDSISEAELVDAPSST